MTKIMKRGNSVFGGCVRIFITTNVLHVNKLFLSKNFSF